MCRVLASSGGGDGSYAEVYETDNPEVAKKVPYLVRDADATQYSALVDVANGRNLSIEGPPGSGKSQTIVNLIAAALAENKKVLFVAEKLTALDIVKSRLEASKLGAFILPLQAGRGTREIIYESLKERLDLGRATGRSRNDFIGHQSALERQRAGLQGYLDALGSQFGTTSMTVYQAIGHGIATAEIREAIPKNVRRIRLDDAEHLDREAMDALVGDAEVFAERLSRSHRMPRLWLASNVAVANREEAEDIGEAVGQLALEMDGFVKKIPALGLAPFVTSVPFSVELDAVEALLRTVVAEAGRIDLALVESLANAERRRQVLTFCDQIHKRQKAHARLARSLKDPADRNIAECLDAVLCFAIENGDGLLPKRHRGCIAALEQEISDFDTLIAKVRKLPSRWAAREGTTLRSIRDDAVRLMDFSDDIRALRRSDANRQAASLAAEVHDTVRSLSNTLAEILETLPKAGNHDLAQIRATAETIRNSGVFRLLSPKFRKACHIYRDILGGGPNDERVIMALHLDAYATWLEERRSFGSDTRFSAVFGEIFKGFESKAELITQASGFYACCQDIAKNNVGLQQYLETGHLALVEEIARIETAPACSLTELEALRATQAKHLAQEKALLEESEGHLAFFKDRVGIERAEIEEIILVKDQKEELTACIEASPAASLLGERFAGVETRTDVLQVECELAERLTEALAPGFAISILRSGIAPDLLEELRTFKVDRDSIDKSASDLWTCLDLPEELRSTAVLHDRIDDLKVAASNIDALLEYAQLKRSENRLRAQGLDVLADWVIEEGEAFEPERLGPIVRAIIAKSMADRACKIHSKAFRDYDGQDFDRIRKEIAKLDRELIEMSRDVIQDQLRTNAELPRGNGIGKKSTYTDMSLIVNEMGKKRNRLGVRELTRRAGKALLALKPCWMMSPLAVAQYLHEDMAFDLVVIDEASQMTPENAIGALSRARQVVIVGDTKQLPPTSFFQGMLDDSDVDEDLREDSESILDLANTAFMPIRQLRWHYRSRHPSLIQFSNETMYNGELTIFPSARENDRDLGVKLVEVEGSYKARRNMIEASAVVAAAVRHMKERPDLSLGICTMNLTQKDLILEEFEREHDRDPNVQAYVAHWEKAKDALEEFFIKNLETIQGDERDVMFISTLYGPEELGGRVMQRFGPINSANGHRRLNVLFSRAKRKMVTFTSMKPSDIIADGKNRGVQMFRAWLEYCRTGKIEGMEGLGGETESPFEKYVADQIDAMGCEVVPQVGVAGFRIDLGVRHPEWPYGFILGVECDGATYHSSRSSRDRDRLRQEVLEGLGWKLHRIWSTDWFRNPRPEIEKLREAIDAALDEAKKEKLVQDIKEPAEIGEDAVMTDRPHTVSLYSKFSEETIPSDGAVQKFFNVGSVEAEPVVEIGSKVKIEFVTDGGKKSAFTLVEGENDPDKGILGIHTPLGAALVDTQVGDEVEYRAGPYVKEARVLAID